MSDTVIVTTEPGTGTPAAAGDPPANKEVFYDKSKPADAAPAPAPAAAPVVENADVKPADGGSIATGKIEVDPAATGDNKTEDVNATPTEIKKEDLKLPENATLDAARVDDLFEFAKENKLSKDQAQAILNREDSLAKASRLAGSEEFQLKQQESHMANKQEWFKQAQSDKEFGGANFNKNAEKVYRVVEEFFPAGAKELLDKTGFGNHIAVLTGFKKIADVMGEDHFRKGGLKGSDSAKKNDKDIFFPSMNKQN